jgi:hypothetical protein
LIGMGELRFLNKIESIEIQQYPDVMEFRMKIWITLTA